MKPTLLIEPFAGGGIIGLTAAFESLADKVILVERDENVAAVWKTILGSNVDWLTDKISKFEMNAENVLKTLEHESNNESHLAFKTILRNRTHHGGIMAHGSNLTKHGENGNGIASRWYAKTLVKRIQEIHAIRDRITFYEGDGFQFIKKHKHKNTVAFFLDPPYTASTKKAGKRLYQHNDIDHKMLFEMLSSSRGQFLMTYDEDNAVKTMVYDSGMECCRIPMKSRTHIKMYELLISNDFNWLNSDMSVTQRTLF